MVGVPTNFRSNICVCIIPLLLLLLLIPLLLYLLPQLSSEPVTTLPPVVPTPMPAPPPTEPYDCKSQGLWSFDKKGWCCQHYGVGCPQHGRHRRPHRDQRQLPQLQSRFRHPS